MRTEVTRERAASARGSQAALAAALAVAGGTSAYGAVVRFDNPQGPGHFEWATPLPGGSQLRWLDFTQDAASQPTSGGNSSAGGPTEIAHVHDAQAMGRVLSNADTDPVQFQSGGYAGYFVVGVGPDTLIPSGYAWENQRYAYYAGFPTELPEGTPTYIGLRFNGPNWQYGWIGVIRTGAVLDAFAWGYETEPGVPIAAGAVPAPGSLALLAFGAVAGARRPRRKCC